MDHSVALLYRPKILKRLTEGPSAELCTDQDDPNAVDTSDELVNAMNNVIGIITLSAKCLLRFSPNLLNLLCDVDFYPGRWYPLIEIQFGVPKMNADNYSQLSFGTVLRAVCMFTKVLNVVSSILCCCHYSESNVSTLPISATLFVSRDSTKSTSRRRNRLCRCDTVLIQRIIGSAEQIYPGCE